MVPRSCKRLVLSARPSSIERVAARTAFLLSRSEQPGSRVLILAGTRHSPRGGTSRRRALALSVIRFCAGPAMAFGGVVIGEVKSGTAAVDLLADRIDLIEAVTDMRWLETH